MTDTRDVFSKAELLAEIDRLRAELADNDQAMHELNDELGKAARVIARVRRDLEARA